MHDAFVLSPPYVGKPRIDYTEQPIAVHLVGEYGSDTLCQEVCATEQVVTRVGQTVFIRQRWEHQSTTVALTRNLFSYASALNGLA